MNSGSGQLPTKIARGCRLLTAAEFHRLADVPAETEWFANITNPHKRGQPAALCQNKGPEKQ